MAARKVAAHFLLLSQTLIRSATVIPYLTPPELYSLIGCWPKRSKGNLSFSSKEECNARAQICRK